MTRATDPAERVGAAELSGKPLTKREIQALSLLSQGLTYKVTAEHLGLALPTIKTMAQRIYRKLDALNLAHAIHVARQRGVEL